MVLFPNCKINLGLNIVNKRADGYHDIETVFYPLPFKDVIEVVASGNKDSQVEFTSSGISIQGVTQDNLCVKAYNLLKRDHSDLPPVKMHLHKAIPAGAGLGGGSADGAFMLQLLNTKFNLGLSDDKLLSSALELGSDCPFFIINRPCFATGRGEVLQEVALDLSAYHFLLVNPSIHVNTASAFSQITPHVPKISVREIITKPVTEWKNLLKNDFEEGVARQHVEVSAIKQELYKNGAVYASMTGSGSTVFGIFNQLPREQYTFSKEWVIFSV